MRVTNETHMQCLYCGKEAEGLQDINTLFGYRVDGEEITPYAYCRECGIRRSSLMRPVDRLDQHWESASGWGRKIHINKTKFEDYLLELGYLRVDSASKKKHRNKVLTDKGRMHSALTNVSFSKVLLWDYNTFLRVVKLRAERSVMHELCPECKSKLDLMPGFNHLDYEHQCAVCGTVTSHCLLDATFDK